MPSVCFYFQVHQPFRLKKYGAFSVRNDQEYFDDQRNGEIFRKVAQKCYQPTNQLLLDLIQKYEGNFRVSFSLTGVAVEQMQKYAPEVLESFIKLSKTGAVEFLAETYYHSLTSIYHMDEFQFQIKKHSSLMENLFGKRPVVFRNTELIYHDQIGVKIFEMGFKGILAEGADDILGWRSPNFLYSHPENGLPLLLKNYRLSDDIAFRFSNRGWSEFPLTAPKFAHWVHQVSGGGEVVNLFMDYETFGEHQWEDTGIFNFLTYLPREILKHCDWNFKTPSEMIASYPQRSSLSYPRYVSWADTGRDLTAWQGNQMQMSALQEIHLLEQEVSKRGDQTIQEKWRRLLTSDHFYYMCTKWFSDGDVHSYFSPYSSPYDAFLYYMNVVNDLKFRLGRS